jgi:hypothetical protein
MRKTSKIKILQMFKRFIPLVLISLIACKTSSTNTKTQAEAPPENYTYTDKQVTMERYLSTLNLDINIALVDIEKLVNGQINGLIYEDNSMTDNNNDQFMTKIWKREAIKLGHEANALTYTVPLKVWLKVGQTALGMHIEKDTEFDMNVSFKTIFGISTNWELQAQTSLMAYDFVTTPKIKLGPIDIPITSLVKKGLDKQSPEIIKAIDKSFAEKLQLKNYVLQAWNAANQPYLLSDQYRSWLKISPAELQMTPLIVANGSISTQVGFKAYTEAITGAKPQVQAQSQLPNLKTVERSTNDFKVGIMASISHAEAVRIAKDTIVGQNFEFQSGKYKIKVDDIDIYGNENQLIIKTELSGSIDGTIYFKGLPYYDINSRSVKLKNFDYDLKTKNLLAKAASWLLAGKLASTMQAALEIPLGSQIDDVKKELGKYLSGHTITKGVNLTGKLNNLAPEQVYLTPNSIIAKVMATGQMSMTVKGL